ncbi:hypothetical protein NVP1101O_033 [Vibrio phage 1.101.O._10N.261.45.C6]|nr:hypothetical protein NVP1101O_033 [Vibrio phage 1.101.O._10N.261.45.C6]
MSQDDWQLLDSLINQACRTSRFDGERSGYRKGVRENLD